MISKLTRNEMRYVMAGSGSFDDGKQLGGSVVVNLDAVNSL